MYTMLSVFKSNIDEDISLIFTFANFHGSNYTTFKLIFEFEIALTLVHYARSSRYLLDVLVEIDNSVGYQTRSITRRL